MLKSPACTIKIQLTVSLGILWNFLWTNLCLCPRKFWYYVLIFSLISFFFLNFLFDFLLRLTDHLVVCHSITGLTNLDLLITSFNTWCFEKIQCFNLIFFIAEVCFLVHNTINTGEHFLFWNISICIYLSVGWNLYKIQLSPFVLMSNVSVVSMLFLSHQSVRWG